MGTQWAMPTGHEGVRDPKNLERVFGEDDVKDCNSMVNRMGP